MKLLAKIFVSLGLMVASVAVHAQAYPSLKPVKIIVATQTGSASDVLARLVGDGLSRALNQTFVIENRGGAGGNIGLNAAAKAAPDGYTLVLGNLGGNIMNQFLYPSLDFNPEKDFEPIAGIAGIPFVIAVNVDFPAKNLQELIAAAKAKPGSINAALDSTSVKVTYAQFSSTSGANLFPVSYNGPALAVADVLSGRVPVIVETLGAVRQLVSGGKLRALAITTQSSTELLPGVASVSEQGVPGFGEVTGWVGLMGPAGMNRDIVNLLNAEVNKILRLPETRQKFLTMGFQAKLGSPQDFAKFVLDERARFGPLIKAANLKAE